MITYLGEWEEQGMNQNGNIQKHAAIANAAEVVLDVFINQESSVGT
jgi:hypothetical protein